MPTRFARRRLAAATLAVLGLAAALAALAADPKPDPKADPRAAIAKKLEVPVDAVRPSVVAGLYEVAHGGEVLYVTGDGRYAFTGDLYETDKGKNLTEQRRSETRLAALKTVADEEAIIFSPKTPRYTVTVFTDVDCQYCRKLHSEIAEFNRLGVRVRYVFYPRSGPGTDSWRKAEVVWCSANRQEALTRAKQGAEVTGKVCKNTPVARTYALGQELGIRGTPGIFTDRGDYLPGYYPPAQLVEKLKELETGGAG
ncbi:MAG TPA: DsbC family protein [Steroidobacteraceae bacterium]|nr:DsbC family protein [Steroidobacteraceae bacterium]